ncbi:AT-rich interactive domain-containing protein 2-like [Trifolium pratense]|uniref:AT-rich interactive domain-containing protein 2-like n=1 Tax=Trifolium pratense TaxID=57577 RepID=A0A2K3MLT9_TRIPR|nr:AT-rich interactive domain-containing protein 2-like [Trifolium pratense]
MENESSLDRHEAKTFAESHGNGDCLIEDCVDNPDHDSAKQKSLFSQQFSVYLEENCSRGNVRPVPVILGDGQLLDLYQLFSLVKEKGGYDAVSKKGLWYSVIIELGLDLHVLASVKLVYYKYLRDFEGWLSKTKRVAVNQTGDGSLLGTENLINKLPNFHMNAEPLPNFLAVRKNAEPNCGSSSQKVKMHPAVYEDPVGHQGTTKLRRGKRRHISSKSRCTGCNSNSCSANGNELHCSVNMAAKPDATEKKKSAAKPKSTRKKTSKPSCNDFPVKHVSIGSRFQAEVPQWTGEISESDSKWLGTQVWTVKDDSEPTPETDIVGRGRRGKCSCDIQGSVECVRFLIAGNRMKLKLELGSAFYQMGFHKMGEEVSLQWTADEEKKFKNIMRLNIPSQNKSFWNNPSKYFFKKTRKDMVNYYFNAYIIQLRSYQNRVTPKTVDSDDDEVEFGSFGDGFGRNSIKHPPVEFLECSENKRIEPARRTLANVLELESHL